MENISSLKLDIQYHGSNGKTNNKMQPGKREAFFSPCVCARVCERVKESAWEREREGGSQYLEILTEGSDKVTNEIPTQSINL